MNIFIYILNAIASNNIINEHVHDHKVDGNCEICDRKANDIKNGNHQVVEELLVNDGGYREGWELRNGKRVPSLEEVRLRNQQQSELEKAEEAAAKASIEIAQKELEAKKLEKIIAEKKKHDALHAIEREIDNNNRKLVEVKFKPEFIAKETQPIVTFPPHRIFQFPFHEQQVMNEMRQIRENAYQDVVKAMQVAELQDITQDVEASKGNKKGPEFDQIIQKIKKDSYMVPTDVRSGEFVISGKSLDEHRDSKMPEETIHYERIPEKISARKAKEIADGAHKVGSSFNIFEE